VFHNYGKGPLTRSEEVNICLWERSFVSSCFLCRHFITQRKDLDTIGMDQTNLLSPSNSATTLRSPSLFLLSTNTV